MSDEKKESLLKPKYWPLHFGIFLMRGLAALPGSWRVALGNGLGGLMFKLAKRRKSIARTNLNICFPNLPLHEREILLKRNFKASGRGLVETMSCWFSDLKPQQENCVVLGKENLDAAVDKGKGVILLSFHMTSLEIGGGLIANQYPVQGIYKTNRNPLIEKVMREGRLRYASSMIDRNNVRATIRALRNKQIIWYATDQNYGGKTSVFVPFFGTLASTITATTKYAKMTGATVIPFTQKRLEKPDCYELTLHPAFENFPGKNEVEDATVINQFLENYLKKQPEDYMWLHQRFRSRPEGEPPIY